MLVEGALDTTIVVATHHADELASVCDRVLVLDDGLIVFAGEPAVLAATARGHVWETDRPQPDTPCRAIGPGRFRCVGPTVADGYLMLVQRP